MVSSEVAEEHVVAFKLYLAANANEASRPGFQTRTAARRGAGERLLFLDVLTLNDEEHYSFAFAQGGIPL